ncbi:MAG TPA: hypothetical protein VHQ95_02690 [Pyrinomonadaceae bacterium]|nr:hypothetical protein [Pyrinomonadaceae bacterium]
MVLQQERAKGDGENQAKIFGPITGQHLECNEVHFVPTDLSIIVLSYAVLEIVFIGFQPHDE